MRERFRRVRSGHNQQKQIGLMSGWNQQNFNRCMSGRTRSTRLGGEEENKGSKRKGKSIEASCSSPSAAGMWAGPSSLPLYSTRIPTGTGVVAGSHPWSD